MAAARGGRSVAAMLTTTTRTVNGVRLYHEQHGSGAPILCVHGAGSSAAAWAPATRELARLGRVIAYDRRGYARSERPDGDFTTPVRQHTDDAAALLAALDATPAVVIGRSYGGSVAIDLALRHPECVRALVLLEAVPESLDAEAEQWVRGVIRRALAAGQRGPAAAAEALHREVLGDAGWAALPQETRRIVIGNGPAILADLRDDGFLDFGPHDLARIDKPTLIVSAADSPPAFRRANARAAAAIPGARTALVGGGHLVDPADPAVLAFVAEVLA
jgi:esterase